MAPSTATKDNDKKDAPCTFSVPIFDLNKLKLYLAASTTTPSTTGPVVAIPPPSMLRGKTLEEIVNRWTTELETNVREFNRFAAEVAVWDRALIENGNNVNLSSDIAQEFALIFVHFLPLLDLSSS